MATYTGSCGATAYWEFDESTGTLRIYGTGAMDDYMMFDGLDGGTPWMNYNIENLVIENGITEIGEYAFANCHIGSVSLPETLETIGADAFYFTYNLTSVIIPASVESINTCAFNGCGLSEITFLGNPPTMGYGAFDLGAFNSWSATVYTTGWGSDDVFTTYVRGYYTTFTYETLGDDTVTQACEFTSVTFTKNPAKTGVSLNLIVTLRNFDHNRLSQYTHIQLSDYTHDELGGKLDVS